MTRRDLYKKGIFVRTLADTEDNYIIQDGESIRVPFNMMDSMQRFLMQDSLTPTAPRSAPGYVADSEYEDRSQRFFDRKQQIADAWKQTPPLAPTMNAAKPADHQPVTQDADAAYKQRNAALERAYLGGA